MCLCQSFKNTNSTPSTENSIQKYSKKCNLGVRDPTIKISKEIHRQCKLEKMGH